MVAVLALVVGGGCWWGLWHWLHRPMISPPTYDALLATVARLKNGSRFQYLGIAYEVTDVMSSQHTTDDPPSCVYRLGVERGVSRSWLIRRGIFEGPDQLFFLWQRELFRDTMIDPTDQVLPMELSIEGQPYRRISWEILPSTNHSFVIYQIMDGTTQVICFLRQGDDLLVCSGRLMQPHEFSSH